MKKLLTALVLGWPPPAASRPRPGPPSPSRWSCRSRRAARPTSIARAHRPVAAARRSARPSSSTTRPAPPAPSAPPRSSAPRPTATPSSSPRSARCVIAPHLIKGVQYDALKDFDLHHRRRAGAQRARRAGRLAAQVARRRDRVPEGQPGQDDLRLVGQRLERPPDRRAVLAARAAPPACTCRTRAAARRSPTCSAARSTRRSRTSTRCSSTSRRQAAGAGRHRRRSARRCCPTCRRWPKPA